MPHPVTDRRLLAGMTNARGDLWNRAALVCHGATIRQFTFDKHRRKFAIRIDSIEFNKVWIYRLHEMLILWRQHLVF